MTNEDITIIISMLEPSDWINITGIVATIFLTWYIIKQTEINNKKQTDLQESMKLLQENYQSASLKMTEEMNVKTNNLIVEQNNIALLKNRLEIINLVEKLMVILINIEVFSDQNNEKYKLAPLKLLVDSLDVELAKLNEMKDEYFNAIIIAILIFPNMIEDNKEINYAIKYTQIFIDYINALNIVMKNCNLSYESEDSVENINIVKKSLDEIHTEVKNINVIIQTLACNLNWCLKINN